MFSCILPFPKLMLEITFLTVAWNSCALKGSTLEIRCPLGIWGGSGFASRWAKVVPEYTVFRGHGTLCSHSNGHAIFFRVYVPL